MRLPIVLFLLTLLTQQGAAWRLKKSGTRRENSERKDSKDSRDMEEMRMSIMTHAKKADYTVIGGRKAIRSF